MGQLRRFFNRKYRVTRAVASGLFDHMPFPLFEQMVNSPDIDRYIESQQHVQRLILFSQLFPR